MKQASYEELFKSIDLIRADAALLGFRENVTICSYSLIRINCDVLERLRKENDSRQG